MKKTQLIESGILIIGLIVGYKLIESILSAIIQLIYSFQYERDFLEVLLPVLIVIVVYAFFFVFLIRRSEQVANYLGANSKDEIFSVQINKKASLHIILIALCAITIIANIAEIIIYLFDAFKTEVNSKEFYENGQKVVHKDRFTIIAVQTIIAFLILYFSKSISGWFFQKNNEDEKIIDTTSKDKN